MDRWTISIPLAGLYRRRISFGGAPCWTQFDYVVTPDPGSGRTSVALDPAADEVSRRWFPAVERGIASRLYDDSDRRLWDVAIVLKKIHAHPVDTTERGCESYGRAFVDFLWERASLIE